MKPASPLANTIHWSGLSLHKTALQCAYHSDCTGSTHHQRLAASPSPNPAPPAFQILSLKSQMPGELSDVLPLETGCTLGSGLASSKARTKAEE